MNRIIIFAFLLILFANIGLLSITNVVRPTEDSNVRQDVLGIENKGEFENSIGSNIFQSSYLNPEFQDYRAFVLDKYFEINKSPLKGFGSEFIVACDKYGLSKDCSVIPAIAFFETRLCTLALSAKQFNCWGFGGSNENRIIFKDFTESIDYVTRTLAHGYGNNLFIPENIASTYTGNEDTNWATSVNQQRVVIQNIASTYNLPGLKQ